MPGTYSTNLYNSAPQMKPSCDNSVEATRSSEETTCAPNTTRTPIQRSGNSKCYVLCQHNGLSPQRWLVSTISDYVIGCFFFFCDSPNSSSCRKILGPTQPLIGMSREFGKGRLSCNGDNLAANCEQLLQKVWEPQRPQTLWVPGSAREIALNSGEMLQ
jgi:hypothetical protein